MSDDWLRPLGATGLVVSAIGAGGGPLGGMPETSGRVAADQGVATVRRILAGPITLLDTSNGYGGGESERRIGTALGEVGGIPSGFVLATKVDRGADGSFGAARVRQSLEESLQRLGLDRIQLLFLHDPEFAVTFDEAMAPQGAVPELLRLKEEGLAGVIGVAGGEIALMRRFVETGAFDVLLTHSRYSLVDRSADETITFARGRGVAVVNAAVLGGGILAVGTSRSTRYGYRDGDRRDRGCVPQSRRPARSRGDAVLPARRADQLDACRLLPAGACRRDHPSGPMADPRRALDRARAPRAGT
jgi:D-threo-aldose 1-dehydrogenase